MEADIQETPFVKQLAANDRPTRDAAIHSLKIYLSGRRELTSLDLLKLWKGLFYCMWMSDRPLTQQALATSLATLPTDLPPNNKLPFIRAFWLTMSREWTNIDVLRMEKFLLLTRRYLGAMMGYMRGNSDDWNTERIEKYLKVLREIPLDVEDNRIPNGMRYHVIDIFIDELEKTGVLEQEMEEKERIQILEQVLEPLKTLAEKSPTKAVRRKAKEALADERLPGNEKVEVPEDPDEWAGFKE